MISDCISLEVKITQDGNKWCALSGKDLQEGTAGFGDTPFDALRELINNLEREGWTF